jgi:hypothetical protein
LLDYLIPEFKRIDAQQFEQLYLDFIGTAADMTCSFSSAYFEYFYSVSIQTALISFHNNFDFHLALQKYTILLWTNL